MLPSVAHHSQFLPHHHVDHQPPFDPLNSPYDLNGTALRAALRQNEQYHQQQQQHGYLDHHSQSRTQYPRPIQRPGAQDLLTTSIPRNSRTSEYALRRKTPSGTLAAGYDGTPGDRSIQPPATKHILVSSLDNNNALSLQPPLPSDNWQYKNHHGIYPSSQLQGPSAAMNYDVDRTGGLAGNSLAQSVNNTSWIRSLNYAPDIDSVLNQTSPLHPSQTYYFHNGHTIPTVMPSSLQSGFGPTASAGVGPYGPYWPDGAYIPYRPAAYRDSRYPSPSNSNLSSLQDSHSNLAGLRPSLSIQQPHTTDFVGASYPWNSISNHQLQNQDPLAQRNYTSRQTHHKPLEGLWERSIPYHSRTTRPSQRHDVSQQQAPPDMHNWQGMRSHAIQFSPADLAQPRNPEFKEKVLSWAHSVYVDLLASLHSRRKNASLAMVNGQIGTFPKPNIYPKPPRQPSSDFNSQSNKMDSNNGNNNNNNNSNNHNRTAGGNRVPNFSSLPHRSLTGPMDVHGVGHTDGSSKFLPHGNPSGSHFSSSYQHLRGYNQHPNMHSADQQVLDGFHTIRRSSGLSMSPLYNPVTNHGTIMENALSALEILSSLCVESRWDWIDGMLVGGCLAYGLGDYDKAMRWYSRILHKDSS